LAVVRADKRLASSWQAIGKRLASSCRGGQTIVKQLSNNSQTVVRGQGQGRGICEE
jgi:hypothetical protein